MRFPSRAAWTLAVAALVSAASISAHHSVYGVFDPEGPFALTGVISEVEWINPHMFIHLDVTDEDGSVTTWRLETVPTAFMRKAGITEPMLMGDGSPVTITGIVARAAPNMGWIHRITYQDGHFYQMSNEALEAQSSQPSGPQE